MTSVCARFRKSLIPSSRTGDTEPIVNPFEDFSNEDETNELTSSAIQQRVKENPTNQIKAQVDEFTLEECKFYIETELGGKVKDTALRYADSIKAEFNGPWVLFLSDDLIKSFAIATNPENYQDNTILSALKNISCAIQRKNSLIEHLKNAEQKEHKPDENLIYQETTEESTPTEQNSYFFNNQPLLICPSYDEIFEKLQQWKSEMINDFSSYLPENQVRELYHIIGLFHNEIQSNPVAIGKNATEVSEFLVNCGVEYENLRVLSNSEIIDNDFSNGSNLILFSYTNTLLSYIKDNELLSMTPPRSVVIEFTSYSEEELDNTMHQALHFLACIIYMLYPGVNLSMLAGVGIERLDKGLVRVFVCMHMRTPSALGCFVFWIAEILNQVLGAPISSCSSGENLPPAEFSVDATEEFRSLLEIANKQVF